MGKELEKLKAFEKEADRYPGCLFLLALLIGIPAACILTYNKGISNFSLLINSFIATAVIFAFLYLIGMVVGFTALTVGVFCGLAFGFIAMYIVMRWHVTRVVLEIMPEGQDIFFSGLRLYGPAIAYLFGFVTGTLATIYREKTEK